MANNELTPIARGISVGVAAYNVGKAAYKVGRAAWEKHKEKESAKK